MLLKYGMLEGGRQIRVCQGAGYLLSPPQLPKIPMPDLEEPFYVHLHNKLLFIYWCDIALQG